MRALAQRTLASALACALLLMASIAMPLAAAPAAAAGWAFNYGNAVVNALATDGKGNVLVAGDFYDASLTIGSHTLIRSGARDGFVAWLNASGNAVWAQGFGTAGALTTVSSVAVGAGGNILVAGNFTGTLASAQLTAIGAQDAFVLELDSAGATRWATNFGGAGATVVVSGIAIDATNHVYVGGSFLDADLTTPARARIGDRDAFIVKVDPPGAIAWSASYGGANAVVDAYALAVNPAGTAYLAGYFSGTLANPHTTTIGNSDAFLFSIDQAGTMQWSRQFGGIGASAIAASVALDGAGNAYVTGQFRGSDLTVPSLRKIGMQDAFAIKVAASGISQWSNNFGGTGAYAAGSAIAIDPDGSVLIAGELAGGSMAQPSLTPLGFSDAIVIKLDQSGNAAWGRTHGGAGASVAAAAIAAGPSHNVWVGGRFEGWYMSDPSLAAKGAPDAFVLSEAAGDVPGAPSIGGVVAGNGFATAAFIAPGTDGGLPITGYVVISEPAGGVDVDAGGPSLSHVITGLSNGIEYTFTVKAINAAGESAASPASRTVMPSSAPGAPVMGSATAGNASALVSFAAPANNGGVPIIGYTVQSTPVGGIDSAAGSTALRRTVTGLTNGAVYTFKVTATNATGTSAPSAASDGVMPMTVPSAPVIGIAVAGSGKATVAFTAPAENGGSPVTGYTAVSNPPGGVDIHAGSTNLVHTVTGLVNGTPYTFTVAATAAAGTGASSASSNVVTPKAVASVTVSSSGSNPTLHGQVVVLVATVTGSTPTGTISFLDGATSLVGCGGLVIAAGRAECRIDTLAVGAHLVTAVYGGDGANLPTTSPALMQNVDASATTIAVAMTDAVYRGQTTELSITVTASSGIATGNVEISGAGSSCTVTLTAASGTCMLAPTKVGVNQMITATYAGNGSFETGTATTMLTVLSTIDVDHNGHSDPFTDGLIITRYLFGLTGSALTRGALGDGAQLTDPSKIVAYLDEVRHLLDVDGDGRVDALTDGLLINRYAFGLRGNSLVRGAVGTGALRSSASSIEAYIESLFQ